MQYKYDNPTGILQVLFLAGATGYCIQQHVDSAFPNMIPEMQFYPCGCTLVNATSALHVMWVQMIDESPTLNHIIPLMPQSSRLCMCIYMHL